MKTVVILLMGVAGSGKTTIGKGLAKQLGWSFYDADDFHPPDNIEKMSAGIPLTDADRYPWLKAIRSFLEQRLRDQHPAIITCSALKAAYRDIILEGQDAVQLVYLKGSYELIERRMKARKNHFMAPGMLRSQFEALEEPTDAYVVHIDSSPERIVDTIREAMNY